MVDSRKYTEENQNRRAVIQVLGTNPSNPENGRIFVWTKKGWFERIKDTTGGVAFEPVAESEGELMEYISRESPSSRLTELHAKYQKMVEEEFSERSQSYSNASQDWREEATNEDENQEFHQHD